MGLGGDFISDMVAEHAYRDHLVDSGIWETADGRLVPVREMTDVHLVNAIRLMGRTATNCDEYDMLTAEAARRGMKGRW